MTLNLTIVNSSGIWQSSDHQLSPITGRPEDDFSIKHVVLIDHDHGTALLTYAGTGREEPVRISDWVRDGNVHISDWIRETLRGARRTLEQTIMAIRENATRDLARRLQRRNWLHMFSIAAFVSGRPWIAQIRNFSVTADTPPGRPPILDHFVSAQEEVSGRGSAYAFPPAISPRDQKKLWDAAARRPREPGDFQKLLASINLRAAENQSEPKTISCGCVTVHMPPAGTPARTRFHGAEGIRIPLVVPTLIDGIDVTDTEKDILRRMMQAMDDSGASAAKNLLPGQSEEELRSSVIPKNRLRR
jgi:hypothetical protein